jgi:glycerol-3-phosphate dehydrogenase
MVSLAPHLIRPLPILVPAFNGARPDRLVGIGLNLYDVMASPGVRARIWGRNGSASSRHQVISGAEATARLPALEARRPTGAYLYYDCQTDDVRLVLTILGEAERYGAVCANRVELIAVGPQTRTERVLAVRDVETGAEFAIRAGRVVNATGVWADRLMFGEPHAEAKVPAIVPSRGTHILIAEDALPLRAGAIVPGGEGRSVFALPWLGRTLIGTTDSVYRGEVDHVRPAPEDVEYLLGAVSRFFAVDLGPSQIAGAFAGLRPLISPGDGRQSVDISRRAALYESAPGLITITGGKLTTWRRMAKLVVDRMVARDGRRTPCHTHEIPLGRPEDASGLPRVPGVAEAAYDSLVARYGYAAHAVLAVACERPELAEPVVPGRPDLLAEAALAARNEQARTIGDVLLRRTRLGLLCGRELCDGRSEVPTRVARVLAPELGWSPERAEQEVERFLGEARAEGIGVT